MPICWLCVRVCNYVLFFRRQHFIHSLDRYGHLLYAKHRAGHWIYKDTVLAQGAHNLAERWLYEQCVIIKLHQTVQKKKYKTMGWSGEQNMQSFADRVREKHTCRTFTFQQGLDEETRLKSSKLLQPNERNTATLQLLNE